MTAATATLYAKLLKKSANEDICRPLRATAWVTMMLRTFNGEKFPAPAP